MDDDRDLRRQRDDRDSQFPEPESAVREGRPNRIELQLVVVDRRVLPERVTVP
jgi:hypothetical protein